MEITDFKKKDFEDLYEVKISDRNFIKPFIEKNHYSHSINGVKSTYCFCVINKKNNELTGAAIFGNLAMAGQYKKYVTNENKIIELRRFVAIDETPKNFESYVISKMLRWIKLNTDIECIVSYSDPCAYGETGHSGIIYRALNFKYLGQVPDQRVIVFGDKVYHDKTIRTKYKGEIKPYAKKIIEALESGEAYYEKRKGKHRFLYTFKRK
jgi:hypothetical protein